MAANHGKSKSLDHTLLLLAILRVSRKPHSIRILSLSLIGRPNSIKVIHIRILINLAEFDDYIRGGVVTQVKMPLRLDFRSYEESLQAPEFVITDYAKFDKQGQLHLTFQALD